MVDTDTLLINVILYGFLPLWGIAGFIDWCCHRATHIESTSGLKESLIHSVMGLQVGIPIMLGLVFQVNVLILLLCMAAWLAHEFAAHADVHHAQHSQRHISIWEMHVHNYMATLPLYLLILIIVINWPVFIDLITLNWQGQFQWRPVSHPHGGDSYLPYYLSFMAIFCVLPYLEENIRCMVYAIKHGVTSEKL